MIYKGSFEILERKGFLKNIFEDYYFLPGLDRGELIFIDIKTRQIHCTSKQILDRLGLEMEGEIKCQN